MAAPERSHAAESRSRLGVRLTAILALTVLLLVTVYIFISYRQRSRLLASGVVQQVELTATVMANATEDLLAQGRWQELNELLSSTWRAEAVFAAVLLDSRGEVRAGAATDLPCLRRGLVLPLPATRSRGAVDCGPGVRWSAIPILPDSVWLLVGLEQILLDRAVHDAFERQLLLVLALVATFAATLSIVRRLERQLERSERFATIGRLSGGLAHELGAPLSVIGLRAAAVMQSTPEHHPARAAAAAIASEVHRVTTFVEGLLHLSRRRGGRFVPVDARSVVHRAVAEIEELARDADVEFWLNMPNQPIPIAGDETLLVHALRNVLRNAVQALRGRPDPRQVTISTHPQLHNLMLVFEDTGPGVPADTLDRVFEPFVTSRPVDQGMGLGLSISQGIILEHGGEIWMQNRSEGGARVTIRLPLSAQLSHDPASPS